MPVSLYLPVYTTSLASPGKATILVSMFNLAGSIGSSLTGYATDYSLTVSVAVMGLAGAVLALTAWGLASSLGAVFAFAMLFGMFSQICSCASRPPRPCLLRYKTAILTFRGHAAAGAQPRATPQARTLTCRP